MRDNENQMDFFVFYVSLCYVKRETKKVMNLPEARIYKSRVHCTYNRTTGRCRVPVSIEHKEILKLVCISGRAGSSYN